MLTRLIVAVATVTIVGLVVWGQWRAVQQEHRQDPLSPRRLNFFLDIVNTAQRIFLSEDYLDADTERRRLNAGCFVLLALLVGLGALVAWVLGYIP